MDFYSIKQRNGKNGSIDLYPDFKVARSKDIMVRGKSFYGIWDEERGLWSTDEYDVQRIVDRDLMARRDKLAEKHDGAINVRLMSDFSTKSWTSFRAYLNNISDSYHLLDESLTFANTKTAKKDYISKTLPYPLEKGPHDSWDELIGTLYEPSEREKMEWAIGAIVSGEAKDIQKFIVIYGEAGGGKSTILNIIQKLFVGYYTTFEAKALTGNNNSFSTDVFKSNPLVAIQHDGDLSRIDDGTRLNSIVSHEEMTMNEKFKPSYTAKANALLFIGTNKPVKISDSKSGLIRRLIDVRTSGKKLGSRRYQTLMSQVDFELGAIASHCLEVYRNLGINYYSAYRPLEMMLETDFFFNFVEDSYYIFRDTEYISLAQAFEMYKTYCDESLVEFKLPRHKFRDELRNYFGTFSERVRIEDKHIRSVYSDFKKEKFLSATTELEDEAPRSLVLNSNESIFDEIAKDYPAQYAMRNAAPGIKWKNVDKTLKDLDTTKLHYVKVPANHIVIDFDIKDDNGEKSAELNLEAANKWPPTYAEYSKSQKGIHLHYIYDNDPDKLSRIYDEGIEVKVSVGDSSIRRLLTKCNSIPIAHINSGLPLKGEKVIDFDSVKSEAGLRSLIKRNLGKEIHPGTKPSVDFIFKILEDAYDSGLKYDVTSMRPAILVFANHSTNNAEYCVQLVGKMKFQSEDKATKPIETEYANDNLVFFDVEVFSNLFVICWKYAGKDTKPVRMINPTGSEIEELMRFKLVGFNCRRYDNHILYARYIGFSLQELFELSKRIINNSKNGYFREAYNISYTDVYDFSSKKQSLKAFEIELGLNHLELGLPWDQPVPEDQWERVAEYCDNDVIATEQTFDARKEDFVARQILAELSGLSVNDTTKTHTAKIIFGDDREPQKSFVYTDLSKTFPGYEYKLGKSTYRGEEPGEGGYVYAEPGMYTDVALLDIASMHPTSIELLNLFGPYTQKYSDLKTARLAIKHKDYDKAKTLFGGMLTKYLTSTDTADSLAYALKIVINIVYGLTSAKFPNAFKDENNIDNIVAKRGALFMIDLKHEVQKKGFQVAHIKTDSIKIPNATKDIIDFIFAFGEKYGYTFEHEATYEKFCLVNDAVYIAKYKTGEWTATGAEFIHPYVFKTLFSKEKIEFSDLCETKAVTSPSFIYLDMNEGLPEGEHNYQFIGKVSSFCPIKPGKGGGILYRLKDDKYYAITGTKGYRWLEADLVRSLEKEDDIDLSYHNKRSDDTVKHVSEFGDFEWFTAE